MDFSKDQKKEAYKNLNERQKEFVSSESVSQTLQAIGERQGFLLDKTGILSDVVFAALLGLVKITEINSVIESKLGISGQKQQDLLNDINEKIFLPFRQVLVEGTTPTEEKIERVSTSTEPNREDILAEIENPTPTVHPISIADHTIAGPAQPLEITPPATETKEAVAQAFIGSKLTETVNLPSQKAVVTLKAPEVKPKNYGPDPYRESIM
ncbi:MAG: hypothetical protein RLZZ67_43 [Candidatus Parcubacteria bacterium]|jgi:hypothetical protein